MSYRILLFIQALLFAAVALHLCVNDDAMYAVAPKVWDQGGTLYRDVPYLQMPLMAILAWGLGALVGWGALPLTILNIGFVAMSAVLLSRTVDEWRERLAIRAAVLSSGAVFYAASMAGNHALLLFEAAVLVHALLGRHAFLGGLIVGLAFSTKLSGILLLLPLLGWFRGKQILPMVAGFVIGALPVVYFFVRDPAAFWFMNVTYHQLANVARGTTVEESALSVLALVVRSFAVSALMLLYLMRTQLDEKVRLLALFMVAGLGMTFLPGEVFAMHGAVMQAVGAVITIMLLAKLLPKLVPYVFGLAVVIGVAQSVVSLQGYYETGTLKWRDYAAADEAFARVKSCGTSVLSFGALPALNTGLPIERASAAGPFLATLGDKVPEPFRDFAMPALPDKAILLVGFFPMLAYEEQLVAEAKVRGYQPVTIASFSNFSSPRTVVAYLPPCAP